jgi:iturin family lipopeptide synthetase A
LKKKLFGSGESRSNGNGSIQLEKISNHDIAIIGMAGKLPLSDDLDEFWSNISLGNDCVGAFPASRAAEVDNYLSSVAGLTGAQPAEFKQKGYLREIDKFDNKFFNIPFKEACLMNPAQRLFLETAWQVIEDALYPHISIRGSRTGIYLGYTGSINHYYDIVCEVEPELAAMAYPGNLASIIASRISYLLDLRGPTLMVDTACSSSLVALHLACQAIRLGECDMAIAGGVHLSLSPFKSDEEGIGVHSSTGRIRTFDDNSDGIVGGEGCAAVMLKPLSKAIADKDRIYAVIKGSAINQDGNSIGITAPNVLAQKEVMQQAWEQAAIDPSSIGYFEAHGTGTKLGDPIEVEALTKAFRKYTSRKQFCAIGSVKANIGHLDAVAGVAGIIKCALALHHRMLPPHINFDKPNLKIKFEDSPVYVNTQLTNWEPLPGTPRRAGVSSFGLSGTNAHIVLEEAAAVKASSNATQPLVLCLSAKSDWSLRERIKKFVQFIAPLAEHEVADACYSANVCREHFNCRAALTAENATQLKEKLLALAEDAAQPGFTMDGSAAANICADYTAGKDIDWAAWYNGHHRNKMRIPLYPFERKKCWIEYNVPVMTTANNHTREESIIAELKEIIARVFEVKPEEVDENLSFLEMGLNSISIIQVRQLARNQYDVDIPVEKLFGEVSCIRALAAVVVASRPEPVKPVTAVKPLSVIRDEKPQPAAMPTDASLNGSPNTLMQVIEAQLQLMSRQLDMLRNGPTENIPAADINKVSVSPELKAAPVAPTNGTHKPQPAPAAPSGGHAFQELPAASRQYLDKFIQDFNTRTATSKAIVQDSRKYFANNRNTAAYNPVLKELMYPLQIEKAWGARVTDVDGNEYIDLSMGFGVFLLGYNHPVVHEAITKRLSEGFFLGPMSPLPNEVARLLTELTGTERVAFYNSGTEAVMVALRLARAYTGKSKVVIFSGSYHGSFDGVLVQKDIFSKDHKAAPKTTGIPQKFIDDVMLLDYGTDESLEIIRRHAHELAAVLVEPVQSRRPEFQPKEFLHALRQLTLETGVPFIMDEIITGFRICPGGAQEWFGVQADLVTYGKICGGGMPIGIVAGKSEFMHGVDGGGNWSYGDDTHPRFDHRKTFVAGTFCHHPLAMASAKAMLQYLKERGPALQQRLNNRMQLLADELNAFFREQELKVQIVHFGSLFQVRSEIDLSLFFYFLQMRGVYVWEGLTLFISDAHTEEDLQYITQQIREGVSELRKAGLLGPQSAKAPASTDLISVPLTDEQKRIWLNASMDPASAGQFNSRRVLALENVNIPALQAAFRQLAERHTILKTTSIEEDQLTIDPILELRAGSYDFSSETEQALDNFIRQNASQAFDLKRGPFLRISLIKQNEQTHLLQVVAHQAIVDGWSFNLIFRELEQLYTAAVQGTTAALPAPVQFAEYVQWRNNFLQSDQGKAAEAYWKQKFRRQYASLNFQPDPFEKDSVKAGSFILNIGSDQLKQLREAGKKQGASLFMVMLSIYQAVLYRLGGQEQVVVGVPVAGQLQMEKGPLVGQCMQVVPFASEVNGSQTLQQFIVHTKASWLELLKYRNFSLNRLMDAGEEGILVPDIRIGFNMDAPVAASGDEGEETGKVVTAKEQEGSIYDLFLTITEEPEKLRLMFRYRHSFAPAGVMQAFIQAFTAMTGEVLNAPATVLDNTLSINQENGIERITGLAVPAELSSIDKLIGTKGSITNDKGQPVFPGMPGRVEFDHLPAGKNIFYKGYCLPGELRLFPYTVSAGDEQPHPAIALEILQAHAAVESAVLHETNGHPYFSIAFKTGAGYSIQALQKEADTTWPSALLPVVFAEEGKEAETAGAQMNNDIEDKLIALYAQLLGSKKVDAQSHFFRLGGSSLRAIQLISLIDKEFGVKLNLRTLFTSPVIRSLATVIARTAKSNYQPIPLAPVQACYPVSHAQKRLWILSQSKQSQTAYNMPRAYIFEGRLDVQALQHAFDQLVQRHEILRTTFEIAEGQPVQRVHDHSPSWSAINMQDLRDHSNAEQEAIDLAAADASRVFDLSRGPLMSVKLLQLAEERSVFLLNLHHIIADGWSMEVLVKEVLSLYNAYRAGLSNPLEPLALQYKDFTIWQNLQLEHPSLLEHREHWIKTFRSPSPVINLPADFPRPAVQSFQGNSKTFGLPSALAEGMKQWCLGKDVSLIMGLQASVKALIYLYTGLEDQTVGMTMAGRDHKDLEGQIGFYVNTIPLRTIFKGNESFEALVEKVKESSLDAYEHQAYPFDKLVEDIQLARNPGRSPLFDIMVELSTIDIASNEAPFMEGVNVEGFPSPEGFSKYDLSIRFHDGQDGLFVTFEYNTGLFKEERVDQFFGHYQRLLEQVLNAASLPLNSLELLSPDEKQAIIALGTGPARAWEMQDFLQGFEAKAAQNPAAIAVWYNDTTLTYQELDAQSNNLAHYLQSEGIGVGNIVGVMAERSANTIMALLAILKSGAAFLTIDPTYSANRKSYILSDSGVSLLLTNSDYVFDLTEYYQGAVFALDIQMAGLPEKQEAPARSANPSDLAYLLYTSGSTGQPKGVEISRDNFINYLLWANECYFDNESGWTFPLFTSLSFDLTLTCIFSTLLRGDQVVVFHEDDVYALLSKIFDKNSGINAVKLTPSHITILDKLPLDGTGVQLAIVGGEKLNPEHVNTLKLLNKNMVICNEYGPTETTVGCMIKKVEHANDISIGEAIYNTGIYLTGPGNKLVPQGCTGEICIGGRGVARGYRNKPELTASKFVIDPFYPGGVNLYRSGDLGRWQPNGELEYLGRKDEQVKINGYRVEPGEIESVLLHYPGITDAVVLAAELADGVKELSAYYSGEETQEQLLKEYLLQQLPPFMVPSRIIYLEKIPLTSNGKKDKEALLLLKAGRSASEDYVAAENSLQKKLVAIWEQVLGREGIGIADKFFNIGGNSLNATQIIARIFKETGVNLNLGLFFSNPCVAQLADEIQKSASEEYESIRPAAPAADYPVSPSQERLWFLSLFDPDNQSTFNIPMSFRLRGHLDMQALTKSLEAIVRRHESLRTTFLMQDDELRQKVNDYEALDFGLKIIDLTASPDKEQEAMDMIERESTMLFDMMRGPLIRMNLLLMDTNESILLVTLHHIVGDGWSVEVLSKDLDILYDAYKRGVEPVLEPLSIQYKDYAIWIRDLINRDHFNTHREYWKNKLGGEVRVVNIPFDQPNPSNRTYAGKTINFCVDQETTARLNELSIRNGASLFMTLCSVINILLYRYTWATDVVIGAPIAGRVKRELEDQVGYYLNTLALRTTFGGQDSFEEVLQKTRSTIIDAFRYQLYPFDKVVEDVLQGSTMGGSPFFEVGLTWQNIDGAKPVNPEPGELLIEHIEREGKISRHNVWFFGSETGGEISLRLRYGKDLYTDQAMHKLKDDFLALCRSIPEHAASSSIKELVHALIPRDKRISQKMDIDLINADLEEDF